MKTIDFKDYQIELTETHLSVYKRDLLLAKSNLEPLKLLEVKQLEDNCLKEYTVLYLLGQIHKTLLPTIPELEIQDNEYDILINNILREYTGYTEYFISDTITSLTADVEDCLTQAELYDSSCIDNSITHEYNDHIIDVGQQGHSFIILAEEVVYTISLIDYTSYTIASTLTNSKIAFRDYIREEEDLTMLKIALLESLNYIFAWIYYKYMILRYHY